MKHVHSSIMKTIRRVVGGVHLADNMPVWSITQSF